MTVAHFARADNPTCIERPQSDNGTHTEYSYIERLLNDSPRQSPTQQQSPNNPIWGSELISPQQQNDVEQAFFGPLLTCFALSRGKPRGLNAARKLRTHRRDKYESPLKRLGKPPSRWSVLTYSQSLGRSVLQEEASRNRLQVLSLRWFFPR